jgi:hypothetical protein
MGSGFTAQNKATLAGQSRENCDRGKGQTMIRPVTYVPEMNALVD